MHRAAARATARATEAEAKVRATQVRQSAERTVDLPSGVGLIARDSILSTVRGLATTPGDRTRVERERRSRVTKLVGEAQSRIGSIAP